MDPLEELIGTSPGIVAVREKIRRLLPRSSDARRFPPVFLHGETGTGKGHVARVIHRAGPRRAGPFVDVNCAAIPETMLEAELFGFERGAFTDARQSKPGLLQTAHNGTMFLDEIGLLSEPLQAKLLKVIDERSVRRLGSTRNESIDVVLVTATNEDLVRAVRERRFREDLYHRLAVLTVALPPLRERGEDIVLLARHFLDRACGDYGLPAKRLAPDALSALRAYPWPGNIRELSNVMERVALLSEEPVVTAPALALGASGIAGSALDTGRAISPPPGTPSTSADRGRAPGLGQPDRPARIGDEREDLVRTLRETGWNISQAAARLGLTRNTIRYRIDKYAVTPEKGRPARRAPHESRGPEVERPPVVAATPPANIGVGRAVVRWERRRITLMHGVVDGAASPSSPEVARALEILLEKALTFGGAVEELSRTSMIAAFGLDPVEDGPRRAAHAAMATRKAVERLTSDGESRGVTVRIALHVAEALVGRFGGASRIEHDARREAWKILEETSQAAQPDTIVVSAAAAVFLGRRFDLVPFDSRPLDLYRLAGGGDHGGLRGVPGRRTPFVGRRHELEFLQSCLDAAAQGGGQVVSITGEAGLGKSRLLFEFRRHLAGSEVTYLLSRCVSYGAAIPYLPVLELLRTSCRIRERDTPEVMAQKVRGTLANVGLDVEAAAPYLLHFLGLKEEGERLPADPESIRGRVLEIFGQMTVRQATRTPIVLVVEDLHWVDASSEKYFRAFVDMIANARTLLVVTYRPGYQPPWLGRSYATQLALHPLTPAEARSVVGEILDAERAAGVADFIIGKAEGNPFFLEELALAVREYGTSLAVPSTIEEVILARIDRLSPEDKSLLQEAAVIGRDVPRSLLEAVTAAPAAIADRLARLQDMEFLSPKSVVREIEYTFKHALTHEVAYASLLPERRRELHARISTAIEHLYAERLDDHVERLADHARRAEAWDRAFTYLRFAGARAAARSANHEAVSYLEHALEALGRLPDDHESREQMVDTIFDLRAALLPLGDLERILEYLRRAETLTEKLGDEPRRGRLAVYLANYFFLVGDHHRALAYAERALGLATALRDFGLQVETVFRFGQIHHTLGEYGRAKEFLARGIASLTGDLARKRFGLPATLSVVSRNWLVRSLAELGEFTDAARHAEEAVALAEAVDQPFDAIVAAHAAGYLYLRKGDLPRAITALERALALCRTWSIAVWFPLAASALGAAYALTGPVAEALPLCSNRQSRPMRPCDAWAAIHSGSRGSVRAI
jgi:DNA-binding NtrC family response regulator/tetratricopeptide (TPR) repeat protein